MNITYSHGLSVEQYNALRASVGWATVEPMLAQRGLDHTAFLIVALDDGEPAGMARVITDFGTQALIADVIVRPDHQGCGIGAAMMARVMEYLGADITPGQIRMVNLMAADGKAGFYKNFGFEERPNERHKGPGMCMWIKREKA